MIITIIRYGMGDKGPMKIDRLLGILTTLLQNERVTAPYLAEKFEVTRRTIGRDIDTLCQAGIPIITYQGNWGGIAIAEGFKLDKSVLTTEELSGIIAALKGIGSVSNKSQIEKILDKLSAKPGDMVSLREPIIINLASHYQETLTPKIELIKKAIQEQRRIEFDYYYEKGMTHRQVEPYFMIFQWRDWYLFGYCLERKDWRLFKLMRLWHLTLSESSFHPREIPPEKRDFQRYLPDEAKLVALFHPSVRYQLIETYGLDCYTETETGWLRFEIGYTHRKYILAWMLSFGDKVKVLEPVDLAEEIQKIAGNILRNYQ